MTLSARRREDLAAFQHDDGNHGARGLTFVLGELWLVAFLFAPDVIVFGALSDTHLHGE